MPRQLSSLEDHLQAEAPVEEAKAQLLDIEAQLALYDESGPWRFLLAHLQGIERYEASQCTTAPPDKVVEHQARYKLVRHLLSIPDRLRETKARLEEIING